MYLNGLHAEDIDDGQSILSRSSESYSYNMSKAIIMIAIVCGLCIICGCIIFIFSVCVGGCTYFQVSRRKVINGLQESAICNV